MLLIYKISVIFAIEQLLLVLKPQESLILHLINISIALSCQMIPQIRTDFRRISALSIMN